MARLGIRTLRVEGRGPRPEIAFDDLRARLVGIPFFGVVIPNLTGVFGPLGPRSAAYWLGYAWFILLSGLLWHGNRFFLVQLRRRYDWLDHPWRKVLLLLAANVFYTVPLSLGMMAAWYRFAAFGPADWNAIRVVALLTVICVVFVTHVYETVFLIRQREQDLLAVARLEQARVEAELEALKSQIDPHFLFNSLNSLAYLIPHEPRRAVEFTQRLGDVYRYILTNRQRDLVPLADELGFAEGYAGLLSLRFGDAVRVRREGPGEVGPFLIPPISLQVLLENAVKHNAADRQEPLEIRLVLGADHIEVSNRLRARAAPRQSSRVGLSNLDDRYRRITGQGLEVREDGQTFTVLLPLLRAG